MKKISLEAINAAKAGQKKVWKDEERAYLGELYEKHGLKATTIYRLGVFPGRTMGAIAEQIARIKK